MNDPTNPHQTRPKHLRSDSQVCCSTCDCGIGKYKEHTESFNLLSNLSTITEVDEDENPDVDEVNCTTSASENLADRRTAHYVEQMNLQDVPCAKEMSERSESITLSELLRSPSTTAALPEISTTSINQDQPQEQPATEESVITLNRNLPESTTRSNDPPDVSPRPPPPPYRPDPRWARFREAFNLNSTQSIPPPNVTISDQFLNTGARPKILEPRKHKQKKQKEKSEQSVLGKNINEITSCPNPTDETTSPLTRQGSGSWPEAFRRATSAKLVSLLGKATNTSSEKKEPQSAGHNGSNTKSNTHSNRKYVLKNDDAITTLPPILSPPTSSGAQAGISSPWFAAELPKNSANDGADDRYKLSPRVYTAIGPSDSTIVTSSTVENMKAAYCSTGFSRMRAKLPHPVSTLGINDVPIIKATVAKHPKAGPSSASVTAATRASDSYGASFRPYNTANYNMPPSKSDASTNVKGGRVIMAPVTVHRENEPFPALSSATTRVRDLTGATASGAEKFTDYSLPCLPSTSEEVGRPTPSVTEAITKVEDSSINCSVCGLYAAKDNYGARCCQQCSMFFKKIVVQQMDVQCKGNQECEIGMNHRKNCHDCQFRKCLAVGMMPEKVHEAQALACREYAAMYDVTIADMTPSKLVESLGYAYALVFDNALMDNKTLFQEQIKGDKKKVLEFFIEMLHISCVKIVEYIFTIPGFQELGHDRRTIVRTSLMEVFVLQLVFNDYLDNKEILLPDGSCVNLHYFMGPFGDLIGTLDFVKRFFADYAVDITTELLLRALLLLSGRPGLMRAWLVRRLYEVALDALQDHTARLPHVRRRPHHMGELLLQLGTLRSAAAELLSRLRNAASLYGLHFPDFLDKLK